MLLSFVPVMYTAVIRSRHQVPGILPGTCIRARARVPSPNPPPASIGPEPEPSIRRWTKRCYSAHFSRTRAPIRFAQLQSIYWYSRGRPSTHIFIGVIAIKRVLVHVLPGILLFFVTGMKNAGTHIYNTRYQVIVNL